MDIEITEVEYNDSVEIVNNYNNFTKSNKKEKNPISREKYLQAINDIEKYKNQIQNKKNRKKLKL